MPATRQSASAAASGVPSTSEAPVPPTTAGTASPSASASLPPAEADPIPARPDFTNPKAETFYEMLEAQFSSSTTQTFTQQDLLALSITDSAEELMGICQELGNLGLFQLLTVDGQACWRLKSQSDASRVQSLDSDARIIYNTIEAAGTAGIWTKTLKGKTNLHQTVMTRSLKSLENKGYVKQVRNAKFPGRKIYMLKNLNPTDDVTGGPWYSDGELDQDLINIIADVVVMYVENKSWRVGPRLKSLPSKESHPAQHMLSESGRVLLPHPPGYKEYPVASELLTFLDSKGVVSDKNIHLADFQILLDILVCDRKLEVVGAPSGSAARSWREKGKSVNSRKRKHGMVGKATTTFDESKGDVNPGVSKRRKTFHYSGTSLSASDDDDDNDDEEDDDEDEDETPEAMYRSVRRTGYPQPPTHGPPSKSTDPNAPPSSTNASKTTSKTTSKTATNTTSKDKQKQSTTAPAKDKHKEKPTTKPKSKDKETAKPKSKSTPQTAPQLPGPATTLTPGITPATATAIARRDENRDGNRERDSNRNGNGNRNTAFPDAPCARCPLFHLCVPGGPVDAESCAYFGPWFDGGLRGVGVGSSSGSSAGAGAGASSANEVDFTTGAASSRAGAGGGTGGAVVAVEI